MTSYDKERAVLVTGTVGSGKTAIATEMGEILQERGIPYAIVDLDWLGWIHPDPQHGQTVDELIAANLAAVLPNFRAAGIHHYVLARSIRSNDQVGALRRALSGAHLAVVRLTASAETVVTRLTSRDQGRTLDEHLAQAVEFASDQAEAGLADFDISNDSRSPREVATEALLGLGWIG